MCLLIMKGRGFPPSLFVLLVLFASPGRGLDIDRLPFSSFNGSVRHKMPDITLFIKRWVATFQDVSPPVFLPAMPASVCANISHGLSSLHGCRERRKVRAQCVAFGAGRDVVIKPDIPE